MHVAGQGVAISGTNLQHAHADSSRLKEKSDLTGGGSTFSLTVTGLAPPKGLGLGPVLGTTSGSAFSSVSLPEREVEGGGRGCSTGKVRFCRASLGREVEPPLLLESSGSASSLTAAEKKADGGVAFLKCWNDFQEKAWPGIAIQSSSLFHRTCFIEKVKWK